MKVKFCCDNGANIHSKRVAIFDTENDLGFSDEEWSELSEDDKDEMVHEWAMEKLSYWIDEDV